MSRKKKGLVIRLGKPKPVRSMLHKPTKLVKHRLGRRPAQKYREYLDNEDDIGQRG